MLVDAWGEITCDLHERYGIDLGDRLLMQARSWPWLLQRIRGLVDVRSRFLWHLLGEDGQTKVNDRLTSGAHPLPWH